MRSFLKVFFASFLALIVFTILLGLAGVGILGAVFSDDTPQVKAKTVLLLDASRPIMEQPVESGFDVAQGATPEIQGLYSLVRTIDYAATDTAVKGIYLLGGVTATDFATAEELRNALVRFKKSGKFIIAYANFYDQRSYELATVANQIFLNPAGALEWQGFNYQLAFFKDALDKLGVKPEIFYAGQFKSATEPYRLNKMSDANRMQVKEFLESLYGGFQKHVAVARGLDTGHIRQMANNLRLQTAADAVAEKLVDRLLYDDEVRQLIAKKIGVKEIDDINFMSMPDYTKAEKPENSNPNKIAVIYAQGEIVDGRGSDGEIGGDTYRQLIRKARLDNAVKAVVLRVNSPGGSALASEIIWRELQLLQKSKPLVVSMGDYAASGGYYIACSADSIFAQPNTLTGSIGVFSMFFDVTQLMNTKLGISFDEVTTSPSATLGSPFRPISAAERLYIQQGVDTTYRRFLSRVAAGRRLPLPWVDSIGQGRIWTGQSATKNGLVDRVGNIGDAVACAARLAKVKEYSLKEWPQVVPFWEKLFGKKSDPNLKAAQLLQQQMGPTFYTAWKHIQQLKAQQGKAQMRLPFFMLPQGISTSN